MYAKRVEQKHALFGFLLSFLAVSTETKTSQRLPNFPSSKTVIS